VTRKFESSRPRLRVFAHSAPDRSETRRGPQQRCFSCTEQEPARSRPAVSGRRSAGKIRQPSVEGVAGCNRASERLSGDEKDAAFPSSRTRPSRSSSPKFTQTICGTSMPGGVAVPAVSAAHQKRPRRRSSSAQDVPTAARGVSFFSAVLRVRLVRGPRVRPRTRDYRDALLTCAPE
jgi:hypothetical protein